MGMCDYVTFDEPPVREGPFRNETEFQTRQLGCRLDYYRITEDGELIYEKSSDPYKQIDDPRPPKGFVMRRNFTGSLGLLAGNQAKGFVRVKAVFKDGWLQYICL